jgi:hypothetical protein
MTKKDHQQVDWIKKNLYYTRESWRKSDYIDFYERDVKFLLKMVEKMSAELDYIDGILT